MDEAHFKQQRWDGAAPAPPRLEINLHAMTAGVAMLSLFCWLISLKQRVTSRPGSLPARYDFLLFVRVSVKELGVFLVQHLSSSCWLSGLREVARSSSSSPSMYIVTDAQHVCST